MEVPASTHPQQQHKTDVLGIISIILPFIGLALFGLIIGIIGLGQAKKDGRPTTLSRIGVIINSIFMVLAVLFMMLVFSAVPALQRNTRDTTRKTDMISIQSELLMYRSEHRHYPASLEQISGSVRLVNPESTYTYTPSPAGCTECQSYRLSTKLEKTNETYVLTSED